MSSRCLTSAAALALLALAGCNKTRDRTDAPEGAQGPRGAGGSARVPGAEPSTRTDPRALAYYDNPQAVAAGKRLYNWYNCVGCHANGGGAIGPALMDDQWIYGDKLEQIYSTIYQGRPNGMPAWGGKIPDEQIWQIAAYVRSMSLPATIAAQTGTTPSQSPAPLPKPDGSDAGWSPTPTPPLPQ